MLAIVTPHKMQQSWKKFQVLCKWKGSLWPEDEGSLQPKLYASKEKNSHLFWSTLGTCFSTPRLHLLSAMLPFTEFFPGTSTVLRSNSFYPHKNVPWNGYNHPHFADQKTEVPRSWMTSQEREGGRTKKSETQAVFLSLTYLKCKDLSTQQIL